ncbi:MAG: toll/interleukin-1 receptor domain-containing protein [Parvularculaceae bacterium]|nr:toll/interleukin-1 receptor domain-containing protein [Parvularculaceae bacterium]
MPETFISYSRKDRPVAEAIAAELARLGFEVWWDKDLAGGEDYRKKTAGIIAKVSATIVVWSRRSVESEWVIGEASASRERKILIPVSIDGAQPPLDFRSLNTIDMSAWAPGDPLPEMLVRAVCDKTGRAYAQNLTASSGSPDTLKKLVARSWYADFEALLFSFIAQGFAAVLTNIPLAIHADKLPPAGALAIAAVNATVTAAVIMRTPLAGKRLGVALPWFAVAVAVGVAGYLMTGALWRVLELNEYLTFVGFWSLGLVLVLDVARRAAQN